MFRREVEEVGKSLKRIWHFSLAINDNRIISSGERIMAFQGDGKNWAKARGIELEEVICGDYSTVCVEEW